jgi:hypothetical protein
MGAPRSTRVASAFDRQFDADQHRWETAARSVTSRIDQAYEQRRKLDPVHIMLEQRRSAGDLDVSKRIREATKSAGRVSERVRERINQRVDEDMKRLNQAKTVKRTGGSRQQAANQVPTKAQVAQLSALRAVISKPALPANDDKRLFLLQALSRRDEWEET